MSAVRNSGQSFCASRAASSGGKPPPPRADAVADQYKETSRYVRQQDARTHTHRQVEQQISGALNEPQHTRSHDQPQQPFTPRNVEHPGRQSTQLPLHGQRQRARHRQTRVARSRAGRRPGNRLTRGPFHCNCHNLRKNHSLIARSIRLAIHAGE